MGDVERYAELLNVEIIVFWLLLFLFNFINDCILGE